MEETHFNTFLKAVRKARDREGILGDDYLIFPPDPDYGYDSTPPNALTFATMGVDGVHYALLKIDGAVTDDSPVIHISPMDFSKPYAVLGPTFLGYLAGACAVSMKQMKSILMDERAGKKKLISFLKQHFKHSRLYRSERLRKLERYLDVIERKAKE